MRKIITVSLLLILTGTVCSAKELYFDGIGFEYNKGWSFNTSQVNGTSKITGTNDNNFIQITKIVRTKGINVESFLTITAEEIMESYYSPSSKVKIKSKTEISDDFINGIEVKYVEFVLSNKVRQRIYCFVKNTYLIAITLTCKDKKIEKNFAKILNSFSFSPE